MPPETDSAQQRRKLLLLLLVFVLFIASSFAVGVQMGRRAATPLRLGQIIDTILLEPGSSGQPWPSLSGRLLTPDGSPLADMLVRLDDDPQRQTRTDSLGRFFFPWLEPGQHTLTLPEAEGQPRLALGLTLASVASLSPTAEGLALALPVDTVLAEIAFTWDDTALAGLEGSLTTVSLAAVVVTPIGSGDAAVIGSIVTPNGNTVRPDGTIILPHNGLLLPGSSARVTAAGALLAADGTSQLPGDDPLPLPGGGTLSPQGVVTLPDRTVVSPAGEVTLPDGTTVSTDHVITRPDGVIVDEESDLILLPGTAVIDGSGQVTLADGTVIAPGGQITLPDGAVLPPGTATVLADGTQVSADGTVTFANGYYLSGGALYVSANARVLLPNTNATLVGADIVRPLGVDTTPVSSDTPTTPTTPTMPTTPETPSTPATPEAPITPAAPETPETPTTPATPETEPREEKDEPLENMLIVSDDAVTWGQATIVDLFGSSDSSVAELIYPGVSGVYAFHIANHQNFIVSFTLTLSESASAAGQLPLVYRLRQEGVYVISGDRHSYLAPTALPAVALTLPAGGSAAYELEWYWPYESGRDAQDTALATAADRTHYITLSIYAEQVSQ